MGKYIFSVVALTTLLISSACDDRLAFIEDVNRSPVLNFTSGGNLITQLNVDYKMKDEIKGPGEYTYAMNIFVEDPEGFDGNVQVVFVEGLGIIKDANGNDISNGFSYQNKTAKSIFFDADGSQGIRKIRFTALDNLKKASTVELTINAFLNKVPTASWVYTNTKVNDPYEYELDASASVDGDAALGGAIQGYEWNINGHVFTVEESKIKYILSKGSSNGTTYNIKLRVLDNNGAYSTVSEKYITVN